MTTSVSGTQWLSGTNVDYAADNWKLEMTSPVHSLIVKLASRISTASSQGRLAILIYHRILEAECEFRGGTPTQDEFDWQMALLSSYFCPLSLSDALTCLREGNLPDRAVCVTFDDGYADNESVALPILKHHGIPATVFVTSGVLDGGILWNDRILEVLSNTHQDDIDLREIGLERFSLRTVAERKLAIYRVTNFVKHKLPAERDAMISKIGEATDNLPTDLMLNTEQLRNLHRSGIEIGGHTVTHPILATLDDSTAEFEIDDNKRKLEELIGAKLRFFAYPNGAPGRDYHARHVEIVKRCGYEAAVSTQRGVNSPDSDLLQLARFTPWDKTPAKFLARLLASYNTLP